MFEIEKGIPLASSNTGKHERNRKYPFREMEVGDSFFVPTNEPKKFQRSVAASAHIQKPKRFATRQCEGGVRVWRVE